MNSNSFMRVQVQVQKKYFFEFGKMIEFKFEFAALLCTSLIRSEKWRQGRREKFRARGQKFRLGPLVSGAPKSRDEQKRS